MNKLAERQITFYRKAPVSEALWRLQCEGRPPMSRVGDFVERRWCDTHDEPMAKEVVREDGKHACWLSVLREDFSSCRSSVRWVST